MRFMRLFLLLVLTGFCIPTAHAAEKPQLWLYYPINFLVDKNLDKAQEIWARAAAAGYTHVLISDSKFNRLAQMPKGYFKNCARAKQMAADLKLQLVPALFSVGYSNDLLSQDPNLAEGLPVKEQPFVVKDGVLTPASPALRFDKLAFHDPNVTVDGGVATARADGHPARLVYKLKVPQFRCYHVSVKVKTEGMAGNPEIKALGGGVSLQWQNLPVKSTQDWTQCDVVFNSLDHTDVGVYFGNWNNKKGTLQWKDWAIEEVGFVNVLRRPGAPCIVKMEGGSKTLVEGADYDAIADPRLGNVPFVGEYESWHRPPVIHTKLPEGTRLRVSWYHPAIIYFGQVSACISEPKTSALLAEQARRMKELWGAPLYMMSHDEFRTCNWDESCEVRKQTPGEMLAANLKECTQLLRPAQAAVWNDMFDPYHNAVKGPYYLVNGPFTNSWEGLDKDVLIVNWNYGKRDASLKFFADRGNPQLIAGYYDSELSHLSEWMTSARNVHGVIGYMYTTWQGDYSAIDKFAEMVRAAGKE